MSSSEGKSDSSMVGAVVVGHCSFVFSHRPSVRAVVYVRAAEGAAAAIAYLD